MELAHKLLSHLFPSRCILCQKALHQVIELCPECYTSLPHNESCCQRCALPLPEELGNSILCGRCISKAPAFDYAHSLFRYEGSVIGMVHQLKFGEKISHARSIGEMLWARLLQTGESPDCLLPVALHDSRLRQRGFNQSIEISRVMAKKSGIPVEYDAVARHRRTSAQTGLDAKLRKKNLKGAFAVVRTIAYEHVLIIDDVMTTGATVDELARLLKNNGVMRVGVLTIARAPLRC
ncbi:MAG: ComF family protein [Gammaproteobacteria bacterium]|nr:ComF family protein [Gammaproteobacteria bacterium]NNJ51487.1 ComF family protein [Gammaproteobacteria bacterium]